MVEDAPALVGRLRQWGVNDRLINLVSFLAVSFLVVHVPFQGYVTVH